jgi:dinuclear metal center YbgI/SA1388 family protein
LIELIFLKVGQIIAKKFSPSFSGLLKARVSAYNPKLFSPWWKINGCHTQPYWGQEKNGLALHETKPGFYALMAHDPPTNAPNRAFIFCPRPFLAEVKMLVRDFLAHLDRLAPFSLALDWDNSGLQVGDPEANAQKVALALDPTSWVIEKALELKADLLITHHPLLFKPLKSLNSQNPLHRPVIKALKGDLAIIAAHTNWDNVGAPLALAETLDLIPDGPLARVSEDLAKLTVFAPAAKMDDLKKALFAVGVGQQGDYVECAYQSPGVGQFRPGPDSQPFIGTPGDLAKVPEDRLELILKKSLIPAATEALRAAHPYEEPAFDFVAINRPGPGLGLLAHWPEPIEPLAFCALRLGSQNLALAGPDPGAISRIALLPGSGGDFIWPAQKAGAQLLITGEINHHQALLAEEANFPVLVAGHYETEKPSVFRLGQQLASLTRRLNAAVEYIYVPEHSPWRKPGL